MRALTASSKSSGQLGLSGGASGSSRRLRIFFSGGLSDSSMSGWQRCECLKGLGHCIVPFDQNPGIARAIGRGPFARFRKEFFAAEAVADFNREILRALVAAQPEIAWLEWPLLVCRET